MAVPPMPTKCTLRIWETCGERCRPLAMGASLKSIERASNAECSDCRSANASADWIHLGVAGIGWIKSEGRWTGCIYCIYLYLVGITWIGAGTIQFDQERRGAPELFSVRLPQFTAVCRSRVRIRSADGADFAVIRGRSPLPLHTLDRVLSCNPCDQARDVRRRTAIPAAPSPGPTIEGRGSGALRRSVDLSVTFYHD